VRYYTKQDVAGKRSESLTSFLDFHLETEADLRGKALLTDGILFAAVAYNAEQRRARVVISHAHLGDGLTKVY
jgi:hypothetical protein